MQPNWKIFCSLVAKAPSSLLDALEQHLASLEGRKYTPTTKQNSVDVTTFSNTSTAFIASDEKQKQVSLFAGLYRNMTYMITT